MVAIIISHQSATSQRTHPTTWRGKFPPVALDIWLRTFRRKPDNFYCWLYLQVVNNNDWLRLLIARLECEICRPSTVPSKYLPTAQEPKRMMSCVTLWSDHPDVIVEGISWIGLVGIRIRDHACGITMQMTSSGSSFEYRCYLSLRCTWVTFRIWIYFR